MLIVTKNTGDSLSATEFNQIPTEIETVISEAGLTPSAGSSTQLASAIAILAVIGNYYIDSGTANTYVIAPSLSRPGPTTYQDGMAFYFVPGNSSTGASTINVNGIGVVNLKKGVGAGLSIGAGDLIAGKEVRVYYDNADSVMKLDPSYISNAIGAMTSIASATTTDLGTVPSNAALITGTTTITSLGSSALTSSPFYFVRFGGVLTLTYNATSLILQGAANIITAAGDFGIFENLGAGNWRCDNYVRASGQVLVASGKYAVTTNASNAYSATLSPAISSLVIGQTVFVQFNVTNTGAVTLNLNGLGATSVVNKDSVALASGYLVAGRDVELFYDGTNLILLADYPGIQQNSQSAAYTTVMTDNGKHIYHPSADTTARTWTIDSNANVAQPIGATITFINDVGAGIVTIAINSDTLVFAGSGTTGSRTLSAAGIATAIKKTVTSWMISGTGLT